MSGNGAVRSAINGAMSAINSKGSLVVVVQSLRPSFATCVPQMPCEAIVSSAASTVTSAGAVLMVRIAWTATNVLMARIARTAMTAPTALAAR